MKKKSTKRRSPKRRHSFKKCKKQYRTRNWSEYTAGQRQRGSLAVWVSQDIIDNWQCPQRSGKRGASKVYSDGVIVMALTLQAVYHQPLRGTQGLLTSVLQLMGQGHLSVPDYTTLCRRRTSLSVALPRFRTGDEVHLVVDSTGCKIGRPLGSVKGSGKSVSMATASAAPGESYTSAWMKLAARYWPPF